VKQRRRAQPARRASGSRWRRDLFFDLLLVTGADAAQPWPISGGRWARFLRYPRVSAGRAPPVFPER